MLTEQIGHYRVTGKIGEGGMGEIYSAFDEKLNRTVAIKVIAADLLDDRARGRVIGEARAAAALDHPFVCAVHDVLEHDGQPIIIMEWVQGETLQARISRGPLPVAELSRYANEIAEALGAAHSRGIIHRDIKGTNIMLTASGHVKVMDFGLAVMTIPTAQEETARRSEQKVLSGTLPYLAPEVLRGEEASKASDLYALGIVMYEMATCRKPFSGKTDAILMSQILESNPVPPRQINPAIPRPLADLIVELLSREPSRRPASAAVVIAKLQAPQAKTQRSLAVLPFRALTTDAESAYLGVALADAVTAELALVRSLLVRPTAAILRYQDTSLDTVAVARELGVDAVVAGTYQRAGSRLRVAVQLIDVSEERPLWSTKVDTSIDDVFAMQDEVSRKIVTALQLELTPSDEKRLATRTQAAGDVLELCMQGRIALLRETVADVNASIEFFERAREIDPNNPLPWIGLADAYERLAFTWDPQGGWYEKAKEMSDRALRIDPSIPEGHYIRARLAWTPQGGFQHEYAIREIGAALAERPNLTEGFDWLATILFHVGLVEEGRSQWARSLAINPNGATARSHSILLEILTGNYEQALAAAKTAVIGMETSWALYMTALAHIHVRDVAAADKILDEASRKFPGQVLFHSARTITAALRNDPDAASQAMERTFENRKPYGHFHHAEYDVACALAIMGRQDEAMDRLHSVVDNGFPCLAAIVNNQFLTPLQTNPRYQNLIADLRRRREYHAGVYETVRRVISSS